jgi:hypothetical protein
MDPDTVERLTSTAFERLLTPKDPNFVSKKVPSFDTVCPFSPVVGRPKTPKGIERLNTPYYQRL